MFLTWQGSGGQAFAEFQLVENKKKTVYKTVFSLRERGQDLNLRPSGYECQSSAAELPTSGCYLSVALQFLIQKSL